MLILAQETTAWCLTPTQDPGSRRRRGRRGRWWQGTLCLAAMHQLGHGLKHMVRNRLVVPMPSRRHAVLQKHAINAV